MTGSNSISAKAASSQDGLIAAAGEQAPASPHGYPSQRDNAASSAAPAAASDIAKTPDDKPMLKLAAKLAREYAMPSARIYWTDMLGSALIGYAGLALGMFASNPWVAAAGWLVAVVLLYRAALFIHEISHLNHRNLPGFRLVWNILVGVPVMVPSFMYEGLHPLHHAKTRYGTSADPEYLPLAMMKPWSLPLFIGVAALAPIGLFLRFALLAPLSLIAPRLRSLVVGRYSGLVINPQFTRRPPEGAERRRWMILEVAASLWAITLLALTATGILPMRAFLVLIAAISAVVVVNQIRTIVAHLWENDWGSDGGEEMTVTGQYLDSVNVTAHPWIAELWAPVGLRFHALHHLLPSVPYHALPKAHRDLMAELPGDSSYRKANYPGLWGLVRSLFSKTQQA